MSDLFAAAGLEAGAPRPLADRLRPKRLSEVVGQDELVGPDGTLTRLLKSGRIQSIVFWGPPGSGKTTIARLLANETKLEFEQLSAIFSGVQDLRKAFDRARARRQVGKGTLLFIDEIHRFNRAQQDSFLPHMEDGTITLVGATTENPSFELNAALLSRAAVLTLNRLEPEHIEQLLQRAEALEGRVLPLDQDAREALKVMADGDGRTSLNMTEEVFASVPAGSKPLTREALTSLVQRRAPLYDKSRDGHYNLISALHKAVRGSRCGVVLAVPYARRWRGPAVPGPAARAHGGGGHRARRSAGHHAGAGGEGYV
jgi:putative ATPase